MFLVLGESWDSIEELDQGSVVLPRAETESGGENIRGQALGQSCQRHSVCQCEPRW